MKSSLTVDYLVGLAMQVIDNPQRQTTSATGGRAVLVGGIVNDLRERFAQAAQVHLGEIDEARSLGCEGRS